jgi:muconolactone delta-isomerase
MSYRHRSVATFAFILLLASTVGYASAQVPSAQAPTAQAPTAQAPGQKQLFLVNIEYPEPGPQYPFEAVVRMVEGSILPSLQAIAKLEQEGKIRGGGVLAGTKSSALIIEAASHQELSLTLQGLPFWSFMKIHVTPLQSFAERAGQEAAAVRFMKPMAVRGERPW